MVSFFGLKFGDKKKKPDSKSPGGPQPQQWKIVDQNQFGEGQFFGQHIRKGNDASSIRSVKRPDTAHSSRHKSPYASDTHNFAAASMFNLASAAHGRNSSYSSLNLKPHASEANMRTRFGANNGSSASLAIPAPAFGSKYRANNGSSSSLALPGPGFASRLAAKNGSSVSLALPSVGSGSRPGTSNGRAKEWVNPLDVHFAGSTPSGPPTPKSPLVRSDLQLPPTPREESDNGSIFGAEADDVVDSIIQAVKMGEQMADEKEREVQKQKRTARLEKERLERQRVAEAKVAANPPPQAQMPPRPQLRAQGPPRPQPSANSPVLESPIFGGNVDERPGSRGGMFFKDTVEDRPKSRSGVPGNGLTVQRPPGPMSAARADHRPDSRGEVRGKGSGDSTGNQSRSTPIHQGPPRHGPPTQGLPRIPNGHRRPQGSPSEESNSRPIGPGHNGPRPPDANPRGPVFRGPGPSPNGQRSQSPAPKAPGLRINPHLGPRSQSPARHRRGPELNGYQSESPTPISPASLERTHAKPRPYSPAFGPGPYNPSVGSRSQSPAPSNLGPNAPRRQESGSSAKSPSSDEPTLRELMAQSPEPLASPGTASRSSDDGGLVEQFARPIIRSVQARRDTLTLNSPRRHSLSMEIEELEKSLVKAQAQQSQAQQDSARVSMSSSHYSDDSETTEPTMNPQPAPLRSSPPLLSPSEITTLAAPRERSPMRGGPPALRRGPRRPTLDEYGVPNSQLSNSAYRRELRNGSISPLSRSTTPQFHQLQPNRALAATPTLDPPPPFRQQQQMPSMVIEPGFKFDFGPTVVTPPTPDSTTWPLASPSSPAPATDDDDQDFASDPEPEPSSPSSQLNHANIPPPLTFDFSPDAYSRDPGLWTPPPHSQSKGGGPGNDGRPSTSQGVHLAAAPPMAPVFGPLSRARTPVDGAGAEEAAAAAAALGIGMARGPSVRDPRRRPPPAPGMVDAFGTGFI